MRKVKEPMHENGPRQPRPRSASLSPRMLGIAEMVAKGLANKEIAFETHLTEGTVKVYLSNTICPWIGCHTRSEVAAWWIREMEPCVPCAEHGVEMAALQGVFDQFHDDHERIRRG
jgi:DNA-binding NarL/FixJ family response regulator